MQNSQINRVVRLVRRTGEKAVIMDTESDAVMMLMDLGAYEKMLENSEGIEKLTEEELMEKINRDVAVWRAYNDKERLETIDKVVEKPVPAQPAKIEPEKPRENKAVTLDYGATVGPEESVSDIASEEGEEKFYLEPVE
ncbi:MAG: hypothetical protein HYT15_00900 [Candidatus Magasanikbacteria bacterium]|nr:hypothetical protein [Candidatus Magasanikbacteria bacterium]